MKINIIIPSIGDSGGIKVVYKYVNLLTELGHDVIVYKEIVASNMHRYKNPIKNIVHQLYCTLKGIKGKYNKSRLQDKFVFQLKNKTVRDADVIIATAWPTAYKVSKLDKSKGEKYYFIQDYEVWDNENLVKESYKLRLKKIVVSKWINNRLKQDLNIGPFPVVYNGVDKEVYHRNHSKKDIGEIKFLMLNHTLQKKGVNEGLQAYKKIYKLYGNCSLRMFGMCDGGNLPEYVEYYQNPSKEEIVDLYSTSDIFIFPSLEEGWGLTPIEAMSCGCVVVGTRTGFVLDLGIHNENMMISEPGNINEMVINIKKLLSDEELYKRIKENALSMTEKLSWKNSAMALEDLLMGEYKI